MSSDWKDLEYFYKGVRRSSKKGQWADIKDGYIRLKYPGGYKLVILSDVKKNASWGGITFDDKNGTMKIGNDHVLKFRVPQTYTEQKTRIRSQIIARTVNNPCSGLPVTR